MKIHESGVGGRQFGAGFTSAWRGKRTSTTRRLLERSGGIDAQSLPLDPLEPRLMLAGDHPNFPNPFNPATGTLVTIATLPAGQAGNGRGLAAGTIANNDPGDFFRFVMPGAPGTSDFVSVLADTILQTNNTTPLNSTLDSFVEVYNASGQQVTFGGDNGVISSTAPSVTPDGWAGFVGEGGQTYYIHVRAQPSALAPGRTATGNYTLRIDAATIAVTLDTAPLPVPAPPGETFGTAITPGTVVFRQDEVTYRVTTPNTTEFNGVAYANAISDDVALLDTHVSVYGNANSSGVVQELADDRQAGRLTNAFSTFPVAANRTYFIRVRSDELGPSTGPGARPSVGTYQLEVDFAALPIAIDPVTRLSAPARREPLTAPTPATAGSSARIYQFQAQGTGLTFITVIGIADFAPLPRLPDPAITIFDEFGVQIAFNDDAAGQIPRLDVSLVGGRTYFVLVEGFDVASDGGFALFIEAQHNFSSQIPIDDHIDADAPGILNRREATPLIFGPPTTALDAELNPVGDRQFIQQATGRGRIYEGDDTDLFQFTAPIGMLSDFTGENGNQGRALYVGGNFGTAGGVQRDNSALWDAGRWWYAGTGAEADGAIDGPIFALTEWDPDGSGTQFTPVLVAGGQFTNFNGAPAGNLAFRILTNNGYVWSTTLDPNLPEIIVDGPVFSLTAFDLVPNDPGATDSIQELIIGGDFTDISGLGASNVAALAFSPAFFALFLDDMGGGVQAAGVVRALTAYDPPQEPDPDGAGPATQPPDKPAGIYVGGTFTTAGGTTVNNVARYGREDTMPMTANTWDALGQNIFNAGSFGVTGTVNALTVYDDPGQTPGVPPTEIPARLIVGGAITNAGGQVVDNVVAWDPTDQINRWVDLTGGAPGVVRALTIWFPPVGGTTGSTPLLISGGDDAGGATTGLIQFWDGAAWNTLGTSGDGTIRTLTAFTDDEPAFRSTFQLLYAGGDFTEVDGTPDINRVAVFDLNPLGLFEWQPLGTGVADNSAPPPAAATQSVFAINSFDDDITDAFDRLERPGTRVAIVVSPTEESTAFLNTQIRVYDSNFNPVPLTGTGSANNTNETINPLGPDPSGTIDRAAGALARPGQDAISPGFEAWPGEVYYIEVAGSGGEGRYTITVSVDALPPEDATPGNGVYSQPNGTYNEVPNAGQWAIAPELSVSTATGDTRSFLNPLGQNPTSLTRFTHSLMPNGLLVRDFWDLPVLETVGDTDLYRFRAAATGFVEIRVASTNLRSAYQQIRTNIITGEETRSTKTKTISSGLDSALRIFNNDFEEIAFNDDTLALGGFSDQVPAREFDGGAQDPADRTYLHRDPRVIIPVVAGQSYFVQVESAQNRLASSLDPAVSALTDWRAATGAYELIISGTPNLNGIDDHVNIAALAVNAVSATPINIDNATGDGSASGVIDDIVAGVFQNPNDTDIFRFIAPTRGQVRVTVQPTSPSLRVSVGAFDVFENIFVFNGSGAPGQALSFTTNTDQGDIFLLNIDGDAGSEGSYTISVDAPGITDDHTSERDLSLATPLVLDPFLGTATASGVIENPGDEDAFVFTAETYEIASVVVDGQSTTLDPFVRVYELSRDQEDPATGNPVRLQVAANADDPAGGTTDSRTFFSTTPGRRYYVVVSATNFEDQFGAYSVSVIVAPTDDHPNLANFPTATLVSLTFDSLNQTGSGSTTGRIEVNTDNDLFRFVAPATGSGVVTIGTPDSDFAPAVEIRGAANQVIVANVDGVNGIITVLIPNIVANQQYYIVVRPGTIGPNETLDTGAYTVTVATTPTDDHPDEGQFASIVDPRDIVTLAAGSGVGTNSGLIVPVGDTDLFRFATLASGSVQVRITTPGSAFNPRVRVFNASFVEIGSGNGNGDSAEFAFNAGAVGEVYYVLASAATGATGSAAAGGYTLTVIGRIPDGGGGGPGPDDHANAGEFNDATVVALNNDGRGQGIGLINFVGDTDLFRFTAPATGRVFLQLNTPSGGLVDGRFKVFNQSQTLIAEDASGSLGATASLEFNAAAGQIYYVLVEPVGSALGSYTLRVAAQPTQHFYYYPEGFAGATIDEFVAIVNSNPFDVTYQLFARYETGDNPDTPIFSGTVRANSRSGVTVSTRNNQSGALVRRGVGYALEVRASGQLGITFSHYDFSASLGEAFTSTPSTTWTIAEVNKSAGTYLDFILFYNPNTADTEANLTLYYENGNTYTFTQRIPAQRRRGVHVQLDGRVPESGRFGVKIESALPIVAGLTSYNLQRNAGDGLLGDADGGAPVGVVTGASTGGGVTSSLTFLNTNDTAATITVTASYARIDLPDLVRVFTVQPERVFSISLEDLGLLNSQVAGLRYSANIPVTAQVIEYKNGDANVATTATSAAAEWAFGDAFINPRQAGVNYLEDLGLYNPAQVAVTVNVAFLFAGGGSIGNRTITIPANDFAFVEIDQVLVQVLAELGRPLTGTAFGLLVTGDSPFVAGFTHYDLFLNGGWGALGAQIGLTNDLSTIVA